MPRSSAIDAARFIASAGVVFLHAVQSHAAEPFVGIGQMGVPFYLYIALLLQARSLRTNPKRMPMTYAASRMARLYIPFLFWCGIYFVARSLKRLAFGGVGDVELSPATLWSGTQYHLWYLPFLLIVSTISAGLHTRLARARASASARNRTALITAIVGVIFCAVNISPTWVADFRDPNYALFQMWRSLPVACWALSFSILMTSNRSPRDSSLARAPFWLAAIAMAGIAGLIYLQAHDPTITFAIRGLSGLLCVVVVLAPWRGRAIDALARFGRYSFGIYLSHVLVVELTHSAFKAFHRAPSVTTDVLACVIGLAGALAISMSVARNRKLSWIVGVQS